MAEIREIPKNIEVERAVLGGILIDPEALSGVIDVLKPDYFFEPRNNLIFSTILTLVQKGREVDVITIANELSKKGKLKQAGGNEYLSELATYVSTAANLLDYCKILKEFAIRRHLLVYAKDLDESSRVYDKDILDILNDLEKKMFSIGQDSVVKDYFDVHALLDMQMKRADEFAKNPDGLRGLSTGLKSLDSITGGLHRSDLIILAARPGVGKSSVALDIARNIAVNEGKSILIFSLEMPAVQVIERVLSQQISVNLWNIRMGKMSDQDYQKYAEGVGILSESKIFVDDTPGLSIMQVRSKARKVMLENGLDFIVIDYLQLMQGSGMRGNESRAFEVGEISRSLKILARELNIPVMALSQLNRAVENREGKVPQLSDLRESGSIEQDADLIMFLGREVTEEVTSEDGDQKLDVFIAKHRNGPTGRLKLKFLGKQTKLADFEE